MAHNLSSHLRAKRARRRRLLKVRKLKDQIARAKDDATRQRKLERLQRVAPAAQI